jgi:hypothetical protein
MLTVIVGELQSAVAATMVGTAAEAGWVRPARTSRAAAQRRARRCAGFRAVGRWGDRESSAVSGLGRDVMVLSSFSCSLGEGAAGSAGAADGVLRS